MQVSLLKFFSLNPDLTNVRYLKEICNYTLYTTTSSNIATIGCLIKFLNKKNRCKTDSDLGNSLSSLIGL